MAPGSAAAFVQRLVAAMESSDLSGIVDSVHPGVHVYITNASGGTDLVEGKEAFLGRFPDFAAMADSFRATVTQVHEIDDWSALVMVEIQAERRGRSLHNFAGLLIRLSADGRMTEYRMVEALPEESDRFWSD